MRIFLLEDSPYRIAVFKQKAIGHVLDIAKTVEEAKIFLSLSRYDLMFLDHDLGGEVFVESGPGTGYEVAQYLAAELNVTSNSDSPLRHNASTPIVVHSCNPGGAKAIKDILPSAKTIPYVGLDIRGIIDSF